MFPSSFNQPKFCPTAVWNPYGITFANRTTLGQGISDIFINTNNTIYTANLEESQILIWINNSINPNKKISSSFRSSYSIFVTNNGDIYYDNGGSYGQVHKWISNRSIFVNVMNVNSSCFGLFIDINDTLYCSMPSQHKVIKRWLNDSKRILTTAAGTGIRGSASNQLNLPYGIFVDLNFDLYVVDTQNNRIQLFKHGGLNGTTIVGKGSSNNIISLDRPTGIVVDADKYVFIVDRYNHRIVRAGSNDIRCIIGCGKEGSQSHQLSYPVNLSFDSYGNIFITDRANGRIQKFDFLLNSCENSSIVQSIYLSVLTEKHSTYSRSECDFSSYYYEAIQVNVSESGHYSLNSNSTIDTYGYMYTEEFYPANPSINLVSENDNNFDTSSIVQYMYSSELTANHQEYARTCDKRNYFYETIQIDIVASGLYMVAINPDKCVIGGSCSVQTKGIGITLDDILRYEVKRNMTLKNQSSLVKMSVGLTMIMFLLGLTNSILSLLTFQNESLRKVGCGIYLLASSVTSLLTISMFTINFWFVLLTQMNASINLSIGRGGCISIEPLLKLFLYFDTWLNACVAIERALHVYQGIHFNKEKSKRLARWIIFILPFCIIATIIHEPLHRNIFEYQIKDIKSVTGIPERNSQCVIQYSHAVQDYNTAILFIHLIGPFIANLFSALFIIFGTARQRSVAQTSKNYITHIRAQLREHKQLVISPAILLILSMPRLIISLLSGCVKISDKPWLYLCAYFISFTPSILVFVCIQTTPSGYLLAVSYDPTSTSNALFKIDPLTANFTVFAPLTDYKAYDVTYDFIHKIFYIFGSTDTSPSVIIVNPFTGTTKYRDITTEPDAEIFGLRVDSSTGKLYSVQMNDAFETPPTSIVQIDPSNFIAKRWVNITKASGVQPDSMAFFFNATVHQYFVTVPYGDDYLVGIDVVQRKIISEITNSQLPAYLCYDNKTNAYYGMQEVQGKRACRLVRLNPYNGTLDILSPDFDDYLASTGDCYGGYYFTMIVEGLDNQNIVTFDLNNSGKIIANNPAEAYLDAFAFVSI
ncbi:unnamed protein product [Adineta steineri]|uniref:G-protein coupled receptors family 1 profile domain-containing protein n=1 Tax=Adineta steineri TaxID=433720 RepID=A0A819LLC3_9BILA|nr:unnamed protein product [Adineta steineri]